jgi:small subunit ribosomal protein S14
MIKYLNFKDKERRFYFKKFEQRRVRLKIIIRTASTTIKDKAKAYAKLTRFKRNASITRKVNRCVYTGTARGVIREFRVTKMSFKTLVAESKLSGIYRRWQ